MYVCVPSTFKSKFYTNSFCHVFAGRTQVPQSLVSVNEERPAQVRARVGRGVRMRDSKLPRGTQQERRRHGYQVSDRAFPITRKS